MKRYKTRPSRILIVAGKQVTDNAEGTPLAVTAAVLEHVRFRRLLVVSDEKNAPAKKGQSA